MMLVKNIKGFTLVELLVVIAILILMIMILVGTLNPIALVNKARDSRRKKDLNRIKVSFEEYFNDKGCYPNDLPPERWLTNLMSPENCGSNSVFGKWLGPWPCDPNGQPYQIRVGYDPACPKWFKILARLENRQDEAINIIGASETDYNYAVSSDNISPGGYLGDYNPACEANCYKFEDDECNALNYPGGCEGPNCYKNSGCSLECQVTCCGPGCL